MSGPPPWYDTNDDGIARMREDDEILGRLTRALRGRIPTPTTLGILPTTRSQLCPEAQAHLDRIHIYPSVTCTYTLNKERIFVCVRDHTGHPLPDCVLQHVLLHELAHVMNTRGEGHDTSFHAILAFLGDCLRRVWPASSDDVTPCPNAVPTGYNRRCTARPVT